MSDEFMYKNKDKFLPNPDTPAPREWWIYDNGEWFGSLVSESPVDREDFSSQKAFDEVVHVIEKSAYDALAAELASAKAKATEWNRIANNRADEIERLKALLSGRSNAVATLQSERDELKTALINQCDETDSLKAKLAEAKEMLKRYGEFEHDCTIVHKQDQVEIDSLKAKLAECEKENRILSERFVSKTEWDAQEKQNAELRALVLDQDRARGYPTGGEWMKLVEAFKKGGGAGDDHRRTKGRLG